MTHTRRQLDHLLDTALDLPAEALPSFLADRCPPHLRARLEALLEIRDDETELADRSPFSGELFQELAFRLTAPAPQLAEGERLGDWQVTGTLGHGGMGEVYRVETDVDDQGPAALKLSRKQGEPVAKHFRLEKEVLAALDHPNVVRLLGDGTHDDGRPYVVLELVEGDHLDAYCDERRLTVDERLRLFRALGRAVEAVHEQGAVHRDLKPSNVLVTVDGHVKLIDFGIAKWIGPEAEPCAAGIEAMTPDCASPEQFLGQPITPATDVYQLGVLLYTLLTGGRPYVLESPNPAAMKKVICEEEPCRPSERYAGAAAWDAEAVERAGRRSASVRSLHRALEGELDAIVLKALRKDPSRRYPSVGELLNAIEAVLGDQPMALDRAA